jgi:GWxTD domain-containing protein
MRRILMVSALLSLLCLVPLSAAPNTSAMALPDLFRKAKEQVKLRAFDSALSTLEQIEAASQQPGLERDRQALGPSLAFYKGVCHAALGKEEDARSEFLAYLESSPNTRLDPAMYPRKVIATFEEVQKSGRPQAVEPADAKAGIGSAYRVFKAPDAGNQPEIPEDWAEGPVRFLLTADQADEFRHLSDSISRSEFIAKFWKGHDSRPETPENEFREEFERRVAFADRYFTQGETRGSYTDRGTVFVLLGPPAYSMQKPMKTGEDTADPAVLFLYSPAQVQVAASGGGSRSAQIARIDAVTGPGTSMISASVNWREVWRYMRKDLPGRLPYEWVDFDFISKPGYGESVLQRSPEALQTLDRAKSSLPQP